MNYKKIIGISAVLIIIGILVFTTGIIDLGLNSPVPEEDNIEEPEQELEDFLENMRRQAREYPETFFLMGSPEENSIALTFDDGPDRQNTPQILDILKERDINATFFVLGENVERFPEITMRIYNEGHQIANHSWRHPNLREMSDEDIINEELHPTSQKVSELTGYYPQILRPPFGAINDQTIELMADLNWKIVNWSIDSFDWHITSDDPDEIINRIERFHHPGGIVLLHNGLVNQVTVEALPGIIDFFEREGYQFKTVNELLFE